MTVEVAVHLCRSHDLQCLQFLATQEPLLPQVHPLLTLLSLEAFPIALPQPLQCRRQEKAPSGCTWPLPLVYHCQESTLCGSLAEGRPLQLVLCLWCAYSKWPALSCTWTPLPCHCPRVLLRP